MRKGVRMQLITTRTVSGCTDGIGSCYIDCAAEVVGFKTLKPLQREAMRAFVTESDVFVSVPTGYGKSPAACVRPYTWS